ncbi:MAG: tetratricopeptide repeat protein, partial [Candidatus Omnitrophota bacterium]|nr:tetratricopeptide repeat protein [Candidatus Omnitrophota bacterium]
YLQLKYLEDQQSWDDYFANGNTYRQQLEQNAQKVIDQAPTNNPLRLKSRFLLWQYHHDQQDAFVQTALDDLISDVFAYAKAKDKSDPELFKNIADTLLAGGEKIKARQVYKLYVDGLVMNKITDLELKDIAAGFYKEGNIELAQVVYNMYIENVSKTLEPAKFIKELFEIASLFVYKPQGLYDMAYAEEIYAKLEGLVKIDAFSQVAIYLRAFNLEKLRDYKGAVRIYLQLIQLYPDSKIFDEANYKIAMINAYALSNLDEAKKYFNILAAKLEFSPHVISSLYQLGLLAQWEGDLVKAKESYELLLKNAVDKYPSVVVFAQERLNEIQENKQIDYNLKTFLDLCFKKDNLLSEIDKTELKSSSYVLEKGQTATISSFINMPQSGCNQVQLQYLWSGDIGGAAPQTSDDNFQCSYSDPGTKAINMVIISPAGTVDRSFTMVDVY